MLKKLLPKGEYGRNILKLMTGTTIAQALPVAISPILTRIYTPEDFGVFAIYSSIVLIFGSIANGRYELAIMLPQEDEDALNIAALGLLISLGLSSILFLVVLFFSHSIAAALGNNDIRPWLFLVPFSVLSIGFFNALNYYNSRLKHYKDIASANIFKSVVLASVQISVAFVHAGATGLITGQLVSQLFSNTKLLKNALRGINLRHVFKWEKVFLLGKRYSDFPKYSMWAILANSLSNNFNKILISSFYGVNILGFYSLTNRLLGLPSSVIGNSVSQVFFQRAAAEKRETGKAVQAFNSTVKKMFILSLPMLIIGILFLEPAIAFAFGEKWRSVGRFSVILLPFFIIRFIVAPVTTLNSVLELQKLSLIWQIGLLIISVLLLYLCHYYSIDFSVYLIIHTIAMSLYYLTLFIILQRASVGKIAVTKSRQKEEVLVK